MMYLPDGDHIVNLLIALSALFLLLVYRSIRLSRWRNILKRSVDYHRDHFKSIVGDPAADDDTRELAQALLWGVTKQLPTDLAKGRGGTALLRTFAGDKTALNTCGKVFYEYTSRRRHADRIIIKLNSTMMSTLYRIYLLESYLSALTILYMDISLLFTLLTKPDSGTGRLYLVMAGGFKMDKK